MLRELKIGFYLVLLLALAGLYWFFFGRFLAKLGGGK